MKKIILALGLFSLVSCNLDRFPNDLVTQEELSTNPQALEIITRGNYALFKQSEYDNGFMRNQHCVGEYGGDNVSLSGTTNDELIYHYNYNREITNVRTEFVWQHGYQMVNGTNRVIFEIEPKAASLDATQKQMLGENLYLRALAYFYMVNTFGKPYTIDPSSMGVPIKKTSDLNELPARASVKEVYDLIVSDLLKAEQYMTVNRPNIFASKEVAQALLSRVYLYMDENAKAVTYADKVISSGRYTLLQGDTYTKYPTFIPEANSETIFAIKHTKESDMKEKIAWGEIGSMYGNFNGNGWGEIFASFPYMKYVNIGNDDLRKYFVSPQYALDANGEKIPAIYWSENGQYRFIPTVNNVANVDGVDVTIESDNETFFFVRNGVRTNVIYDHMLNEKNGYPMFYVNKCVGQEGQALLWSPIVSRLAEIYLNRAEAHAKLGNTAQALADLNVIRTRATNEPLTAAIPGKTLLETILDERGIELAFEAHRKHDIFRNKMTLDRKYPGFHPKTTIGHTSTKIIEFIPQSQILVQPNLIQNPF